MPRVEWIDKRLAEALRPETILVSVMMANNEIGTLQPIADLAALAHEHGALFHTDAVQALGKIPIDVKELDVDLLSLSAHKAHGPKGVGALYVRQGIDLSPLIDGGGQERKLRSGTENVPGIVGFGKACDLAARWLNQKEPREDCRLARPTGSWRSARTGTRCQAQWPPGGTPSQYPQFVPSRNAR